MEFSLVWCGDLGEPRSSSELTRFRPGLPVAPWLTSRRFCPGEADERVRLRRKLLPLSVSTSRRVLSASLNASSASWMISRNSSSRWFIVSSPSRDGLRRSALGEPRLRLRARLCCTKHISQNLRPKLPSNAAVTLLQTYRCAGRRTLRRSTVPATTVPTTCAVGIMVATLLLSALPALCHAAVAWRWQRCKDNVIAVAR